MHAIKRIETVYHVEVPEALQPIYGEEPLIAAVLGRKMILLAWSCRIGQHTFKKERINEGKVCKHAHKIMWRAVKSGKIHKIPRIIRGEPETGL
jgi:hypothetical protein